jgi:1-phosphofructokinase
MNAEPHILTLTGNLLAERTLEFGAWSPGRTQRAERESFQVGGKGINVAKMLRRLGSPYTALCFTGGATGAESEAWLRTRGFAFRAFATGLATRIGTVVRGGPEPETTFLGPDTPPDAAALRACAEFLDTQPSGTVLAVCGSLPGWDSPEFDVLRDVFHRWPERGSLVVDTYGPPLAWFADETVALIRVNRNEFESLVPHARRKLSGGELLRQMRDQRRALRWAISDGPAPVWFIADHNDPESIPSPAIREVSATGSGDVMLACVLHARFRRGLSWRDAVAWSLPYAAANAAHPGVAEFPEPNTT